MGPLDCLFINTYSFDVLNPARFKTMKLKACACCYYCPWCCYLQRDRKAVCRR